MQINITTKIKNLQTRNVLDLTKVAPRPVYTHSFLKTNSPPHRRCWRIIDVRLPGYSGAKEQSQQHQLYCYGELKLCEFSLYWKPRNSQGTKRRGGMEKKRLSVFWCVETGEEKPLFIHEGGAS